jgi:hypothetical protein
MALKSNKYRGAHATPFTPNIEASWRSYLTEAAKWKSPYNAAGVILRAHETSRAPGRFAHIFCKAASSLSRADLAQTGSKSLSFTTRSCASRPLLIRYCVSPPLSGSSRRTV